ncbi:MFS transporter [Mycolicibacterium novocastrense]|uniref:MFS transporter n=1 Tax=Mycolicibacterium novocastrense TaxID=59813 RepID=A0AAW5SM58_MYCNV|nr:MFS transporter [Mycolicibacterium novocastrense]MCV7024873.1 MFS transporter [Mycolicibacterium novocastrense]GAT11969.1 transporter, major facilitator family protein [Mycolicibacterium novocastrense]
MGAVQNLYSALLKRNREAERELPSEVRRNLAPNGLRLMLASALQSSGDETVNASTVLPWLFATLGVPPALTGVLVPVRESGSMLPQAFLTPLVLRVRYRKWVFIAGALVQAAAVAVMAATAALGRGLAAGAVIVASLAVFALGRCLCSIASKDVQGRTIPKGERGQINGVATTAAGLVAVTLGLAIRLFGGEDLSPGQLAWVLAAGAALWVAVAVVYRGVHEPPGEAPWEEPEPDASSDLDSFTESENWFRQTHTLLREDKLFRHFVGVRSLLLVSSLSTPFVVTLSIQSGADSLAGLGGFVIASGLAALIGGRLFGRFADRSSKRLMSVGAGVSSVIVIATVVIVALPGFSGVGWLSNAMFIAVYFALALMHTGVRVGRKTYVIDMAVGDQRTVYVAVSNSAMGFILLIVGGISSLLAIVHVSWALLFLAAMGLVGVFAGARLPEVSRG